MRRRSCPIKQDSNPPQLLLKVLGGVDLTRDGQTVTGAGSQRRPLALLAVLAVAEPQGVPRDRLFLYFWPDADLKRARNTLNQTLYALRRDLSPDLFLEGPSTLRLNPAVIGCDLWEFRTRMQAGDLEPAVVLHGGPFLDGVSLPHCREFEEWTESTQAQIRQEYRDALETLGRQAVERGADIQGARWWRKRLEDEPLASHAAAELITILTRSGRHAEARTLARTHLAMLHQEIGPEVDPVFERAAALAESPPRPQSPPAPPIPTTTATKHAQAVEASPTTMPPTAAPARPPRWRAMTLALVAGVLAIIWLTTRAAPPAAPDTVVAVFPFQVSAGADLQYLGVGSATLLATAMDGTGDLRSADPGLLLERVAGRAGSRIDLRAGTELARGLGASLFVLGEIVGAGNRLQLRATLYERATSRVLAQGAAAGDSTELFAMVDQLAANLLVARAPRQRARLAGVAAVSTSSLAAFKEYVAGEQAAQADAYGVAIDAFQRAIAADSTFALAWHRLGQVAFRAGRDSLVQRAAAAAARYATRLPARDQELLRATLAWRSGDFGLADALLRDLLDTYPDDVDAWLAWGELLYHGNPLRGRSAAEARRAFEGALALEPDDPEALLYLARIAAMEGDRATADTLTRRLLRQPGRRDVVQLRAFRAFLLSDPDARRRATREIVSGRAPVTEAQALAVAVHLDDLEGTEAFAEELTGATRSLDLQGLGHRLLARVALARGQWQAAMTHLDHAAGADPTAALELRSLFVSLPFAPAGEDLDRVLADLERWDPEREPADPSHTTAHHGLHREIRLHRLGLLAVRRGDHAQARSFAAQLDRGDAHASTLAASIRGSLALAEGDAEGALRLLDRAGWPELARTLEVEGRDRFARAESLFQLGRHAEAFPWYASIAERAAYEQIYLAPAARRLGEIHERLQDTVSALQHYHTFLSLWQDSDAVLHPVRDSVSRRVAALTRR